LVKMAPYEYGQYGWAVYEDIVPEFLDFLDKGPLCKLCGSKIVRDQSSLDPQDSGNL
jgi:hypothetical protein